MSQPLKCIESALSEAVGVPRFGLLTLAVVIAGFDVYAREATIPIPVFQHADAEQVLRQATAGWNELIAFSGNFRGTGIVTQKSGDKIQSISRLDFVVGSDSQRCVLTNEETKRQVAVCRSQGDNYAFVLRRDQPDHKFAITDLTKFSPQVAGAFTANQANIHRVFSKYFNSPWMMADLPLPYLIRTPGFRLNGFTEIGETGFWDMHFEYTPVNPDEAPLEDAHVTLWPENHWSIVDYRAKTVFGGFSGAIEYQDVPSEGFFFLKRAVHKLWDGEPEQSTLGTVDECVYTAIEPYVASNDEFSLKSFGVPEVDFNQQQAPERPSMLLLINIIVIAVLGGYYLLRKWRASKGQV